MRILLVAPYYEPDLGPASPLLTMLAEDLAGFGHHVEVITAVPHFLTGTVPQEYRKRLWSTEVRNGVKVSRTWLPSGDRKKLAHRAKTFVVFQLLSTFLGLFRRYDATMIAGPAIETLLPFLFLTVLRRKPSVFMVWDMYPEVFIKLGVFRNSRVISFVGRIQDFCLHRAARVHVLSEEFVAPLEARGVRRSDIVVIPVWTDPGFIQPGPRKNAFSEEYGLGDYFVVAYAGNIGHLQGLDFILEGARLLSDKKHIRFVFVGEGGAKASLRERAEELHLDNVVFLPYQQRSRLPEVLTSSDVALVSLKKGMGKDMLPSKAVQLLASATPVIAAVDSESGLYRLIQEAEAGICIEPGSHDQLAEAVLSLASSPQQRERLGKNGRRFALAHHSRQSAAGRFNALLGELRRSN